MKITSWKTAAEILADPAIKEMTEKRLAADAEKARELERLEQPLVRALAEVGCNVKTVYDLVNTDRQDARVMRVLLDHLNRDYPRAINRGIAMALDCREARNFCREIVAEFARRPM